MRQVINIDDAWIGFKSPYSVAAGMLGFFVAECEERFGCSVSSASPKAPCLSGLSGKSEATPSWDPEPKFRGIPE